MSQKLKIGRGALTVALTCGLGNAAFAQDVSSGPVIQEVVVHAQKRAAGESVQEVPLAVTATDELTLQRTFATDLTDVGRLAPNVRLQPVSTFPNFANFTIRGIGVTTSIRTVDPAVNVYVDGMVMGFQAGTIMDTFDLESIEMLRGPQGILFGRNTTGGAVSLRTRRPDGEFGVRGRLTIGNYNRRDAAASIEGGLGDRVAAKLAVISRNMDGVFRDRNGGTFVPAPENPSGTEPGTPRMNQPDIETLIVKPTIVFNVTDDFDITLLGSYFRSDGGGATTRAFIPPSGTLLRAQTEFGYTPPSDEFEVNHDLVGTNFTEATQLIVDSNLDVGHGVFTGILGYRDITYDSTLDVDGTPFTFLHFPDNEEGGDQFSAEVRYASTFSDFWDFTVGVYHFEQDFSILERRQVTGRAANRAHGDYIYQQGDARQKQDSQAIFGNVNVNFTDKLTAFAGLRYTKEHKELDAIPIGACTGPEFTGCPTSLLTSERDWSDTAYRVGAKYSFTDDVHVYGTFGTGFRSGNYNSRAAAAAIQTPADPEKVESFEAGVKSTFADGRVRMNLALFQTEYDDIQRIVQGTIPGVPFFVQTLLNAATAEIRGVELESTFAPTDSITLDAGFGWLDAKFDEFRGIDANRDRVIDDADIAAARNLEFDRVPEWTSYVAATYTLPLRPFDGELAMRGSWSYTSEFHTSVDNNPDLAQDAYSLFDASLNYSRDNWRVSLFGRNLSNEFFVDVKSISQNYQSFGGMPRTYGVELDVSF